MTSLMYSFYHAYKTITYKTITYKTMMSRANTYQRLDRLEQLTAILKADQALTIGYLAKEFQISRRTLFRDIAILRERGLPIETEKGRGGGIRLHHRWGVGRLQLESQEVIDILLSLAVAESMNSTLFMGHLSSIKHKLMASLSSQQKQAIQQLRQRIHIGEAAIPNLLASYNTNLAEKNMGEENAGKENDNLSPLHHAFLFKKQLRIDYKNAKGEQTQRQIEPHYLYLSYPIWYVLAWDYLRADFRIFRCDRISKAHIVEQSFIVKPLSDFKPILTRQDAVPL